MIIVYKGVIQSINTQLKKLHLPIKKSGKQEFYNCAVCAKKLNEKKHTNHEQKTAVYIQKNCSHNSSLTLC